MSSIKENILSLKSKLPATVSLVAVSKTKPNKAILEAYNTGHRLFGENKVQELIKKQEELPKDIEWHFIGHLQSNKVKFIAPFISLIHAVDSLKLLQVINKEAIGNKRVINCLIQCKIASEESKFGLSVEEIYDLLESSVFSELEHVNILGVMGMASYTDDVAQVRREFKLLKDTFDRLKINLFSEKQDFTVVSMGMSHDYGIAIEEGATMIRVGSSIFGERNYSKTTI
jgi:PLP dependent protein